MKNTTTIMLMGLAAFLIQPALNAQTPIPSAEGDAQKGNRPELAHCQAMAAMQQEMKADLAATDEKLYVLAETMGLTEGQDRIEAITAIVSELVRLRLSQHCMMARIQPDTTHFVLEGMSQNRARVMADCPMMQQVETPDEEAIGTEHSEHHSSG